MYPQTILSTSKSQKSKKGVIYCDKKGFTHKLIKLLRPVKASVLIIFIFWLLKSLEHTEDNEKTLNNILVQFIIRGNITHNVAKEDSPIKAMPFIVVISFPCRCLEKIIN